MKRGGPLKRRTRLKRGGPLRRQSAKARQRAAKVRGIRQRLVREAGCCMACGHSHRNPWPNLPRQLSRLCCHEILRGSYRQQVLGEPCALLVLCVACNCYEFTDAGKWPIQRQLALQQARAPDWYDLRRFNELKSVHAPDAVTQADVDDWKETIHDAPR